MWSGTGRADAPFRPVLLPVPLRCGDLYVGGVLAERKMAYVVDPIMAAPHRLVFELRYERGELYGTVAGALRERWRIAKDGQPT